MWRKITVDFESVNLDRKLEGETSLYGEATDWRPFM